MFAAFITFLVEAIAALAGPAGISATVATAIAYTVAYGTIIGASMAVSKLLAPKMPSMGDMANRGTMTRNAVSARQIIYGQAKVSGTVVFLATSGTKNEYLHVVVALAGHEVQEIGDVYFNEDLVLSGSGDGFATGKYAASGSYTGSLIHKHLGTTTQTVDTTLQTDFPVDWDSNHRLRGIAYIYCKLTFSNEIFVGGIPNISCVVKGKKVYDPDSETTAYSANPALCLRDYLTDADLGMGMDASEIDDDSVIAAAAVCVDQVQVKPVSPVAYENRYECNGQAVTSSTPDSIIGQILSAMGGTIAYSGGQVVVYAAAYRSPTVTLDESQMAGGFTVSTRTSARDRVNAVKGTYVSADNQWAAADFPQITSATYLAADDGIYHWRDVILPFTTSSSAAQRIAVINLRQAREEIIFTARWNLTAMQLRAGDTVSITNANLGWSSKVFEVIAWSLANQGTPPTPVIEMQLRETASSIYSWTVTDEIAVEDAPNTTLPSPFSITAPSNLTLTADGTTQFIQADGSVMPRIKVAWSAPNDQFVQSGGKTVIEYKEGAATTYLTWSTVDGDQTLDYISSDVRIGTSYNVRLYAQSFFNTSSTYTAVASITPAKDTTAPATPTGLTASVGTGRAVSLDWNDNTEADFSEYGIYRNTAAVTPANANTNKIAEVRASRFVDTEVTIGTTYFYWVNAYDNVENVSGFTNYVQATPSVITAGPIDPTAPSTPAAPTLISTTVYLSTDGGSFARVSLTAPPLPAGAVALDVLYRRTGASDYIIGNQIASSVSYAVSIDDLSVGVAYEFAARGISFSGAISAVSSVLSQSAPSNTTLPSAPTALTYISGSDAEFKRSPETISAELAYSVRVNWTPPSDKSVLSYESVGTNTDTDAAANTEYAAGSFFRESTPESIFSSLGIFTLFVRVRSVDRTGQKSAWAGGGTNLNNYWGKPAGTMMNQNANTVAIIGGSITGITDIAVADGGTGASTTADALENLLPSYTTNGTKFLALNIGATDVEWTTGGGGSGTVISVAATGTVNGITLTGTVTTAGFLTLGGTLTDVSLSTAVTGTLAINRGGTGADTAANARQQLELGPANLVQFGNIKSGSSQFGGTVSVTGNITATGDVSVTGNVSAVGSMSMGSGFSCVGSGVIASGGLSVDNGITTTVVTATTRFHSPAAAVDVVTATTRFYSPAASLDVVTAATRIYSPAANLGVVTVDRVNFVGGDPVTKIDEDWGITLNGDATHPVRVIGAALAMGSFDQNVAMTAGRIYLADDRSLYTSGTDLLFNNGSVTISITAAPVVPVVTTVILGYPMCSAYGGSDGDYLRQIVYNSVTYLCFGP
jgi:hypothetical protein